MTRERVFEILRDNRDRLKTDFGVASLALYGSIARDQATDASDVDLLVEFDRPTGFFALERLQLDLQRLLGCSVDINTPRSLRKSIRDQVIREAVHVR